MEEKSKLWSAEYIEMLCVNILLFFSFSMVSTSISQLVVSAGYDLAIAGTVAGIMSIAAMVMRPFSGIMSDKFNRKTLLFAALIVMTLSTVGYALTTSLVLLIIFRVLNGVSFSLATTVNMAMAADCIPPKRLGEGLGIFGAGAIASVAISPTIGIAIGNAWGDKYIFVFAGALALLGAIVTVTYRNARLPDSAPKEGKAKLSLNDLFVKEALIFGLITVVVGSCNGLESGFIRLFGSELGSENIGWYFLIGSGSMALTQLLGRKLLDKYPFRVLFYPSLALVVVGFLLLSIANSANMVVVFIASALAKGIGCGFLQPALQAACISSTTPERYGAATCTYYFGNDIGQGTAPIVGGAIADRSGYQTMFGVYCIPLAAIGVLYAFYRRKKKAVQTAD